MSKNDYKRLLACDFETYHIKDYEKDGIDVRLVGQELHVLEMGVDTGKMPETHVKCWSIVEYDLTRTHKENLVDYLDDQPVCKIGGESLDEFLCYISEMKDCVVYFHNLTYDEFFIADPLLRNNGKLKLSNGFLMVCRERKLNMQGKVLWANYLFRKQRKPQDIRHEIRFLDSLQIYHSTLRDIGDFVGIEKGYDALVPGVDQHMIEYCITDSEICGKAMITYWNLVRRETQGKVKFGWLTSASTAYQLFLDHMWREKRLNKKMYKELLPPEGHPAWLRECYRGASPLFDESKQWQVLTDIHVFDVNSMYPKMMHDAWLPYGEAIPITEQELIDNDYQLRGFVWCAKVRMHIQVKEGHRACFLLKQKNEKGRTLTDETDRWVDMFVTDMDMKLIEQNYEIWSFEIIEAWKYNAIKGLAGDFIDKWYKIKSDSKGINPALNTFAKLILNSLYGKFGSNSEFVGYDYQIVDDHISVIETGVDQKKGGVGFYLPWAVWITANARFLITTAINAVGWDHVCYTDTDSIHCYGLSKEEIVERLLTVGIKSSKNILGDFKYENKCKIDGVYIKNKWYAHSYAEEFVDEDGTVHKVGDLEEFKSCGANDHDDVIVLGDVNKDMKIYQNRAFKVFGGKVIFPMQIDMNKDMFTEQRRIRGMTEERSRRLTDFMHRSMAMKYVGDDMEAFIEDTGAKEKYRGSDAEINVKQRLWEREMYGY